MAFQQRQMAALGLDYLRVEAITPQDLFLPRDDPYWLRWERPLTDTEKAILASHRRAWKLVAGGKEPYLILEDDALLAQEVSAFLMMVERLAQVEHISLEVRGRKKLLARLGFLDMPLRRLYQDRTGAAAYILWPAGAEKLLIRSEKRPGLADGVICAAYELASYQADPALSIQLDQCSRHGITPPCDSRSLNTAPRSAPSRKLSGKGRFGFLLRRVLAQLRMGWRYLCCIPMAVRRIPRLSKNWPNINSPWKPF